MEAFARKLKDARSAKELNQEELGELVGVSRRSINAYEKGAAIPRKKTIRALAKALGVSVEYLTNDGITDRSFSMEMDYLVEEASSRFGSKGAAEVEDLLKQNVALFAGGSLSEEGKAAYYEALSNAYFACKAEAKKKYGKKAPEQAE